ncbi:ATP-binding cassette glutathione S-conjugate transporter ycf1, partial [Coemansia sp. RSA 2607]
MIIYFHDFASPDRTASVDDGIVLAVAIGLVSVLRTVLYQAYWHKLMQPYLWLLRFFSALVYHKSLVLSSEARAKYSSGEISAYLSVDTERLATAINYIHCIWDYPLRIVVVLCALYRLLGYSALAGIAVLVASTQLSALLVRVVDRRFKQLIECRDQRVRIVGETVANIKGIKLYSWQDTFVNRIDDIRTRLELPALRSVGLWKGVMSLASLLVSLFIGFVTFAAYEALNGRTRHPLTSQLVFVSLSLFAVLQEPIAEMPTVISMLVNASRSLVRLCDFAMCDEVVSDNRQSYNTQDGDDTEMMVQIVDGTFKWSADDSASVLCDANFSCRR